MRHFAKFALLSAVTLSHFGVAQTSNLELDAVLIESSDLMQEGDPEAALALLKRYEEEYSSQPEFLNNLAVAYLGNADPVAALTILRQLVDSDPIFSIVAHNLIELEMQSAEGPPDTINPVLFVQSTQSFFETEMQNIATAEAATGASTNNSMPEPSARIADANSAPVPVSTHLDVLRQSLENQTLAWAAAWSAKDLEAYLGFYAPDYLPVDATSNREWRINRSAALRKPGDIQVDLANITTNIDANRAEVSFEQSYRSINYSDRVNKTLIYTYQDERWKIVSETSTEID